MAISNNVQNLINEYQDDIEMRALTRDMILEVEDRDLREALLILKMDLIQYQLEIYQTEELIAALQMEEEE